VNARRLAPLAGALGIGCVIAGLATDRAPTSSWSDARIEAWYGSHGNTGWLVSAYLIALGAPLLITFTAVVRQRLESCGASRSGCAMVSGAGSAFAVTLLVGAGLYAAVPAAMAFTHAPPPTAAVSRYLLGASYGVLVMFSAFAAAMFTLITSVLALRTRSLPRWLAVAGVPAGILMLANAVIPMAIITLWFVTASIVLAVRQDPPTGVGDRVEGSRPRAARATKLT
jgi:hypothetical protein